MKVFLIHGGLWDGWCIVERPDGQRRLVRCITEAEFEHLAGTADIEDISRVPTASDPPRAVSRVDTSARARALGLTLLTPEA